MIDGVLKFENIFFLYFSWHLFEKFIVNEFIFIFFFITLKRKINYFRHKVCSELFTILLFFVLLTYFNNLIFKAKSLKLRPSNKEYLKHIL